MVMVTCKQVIQALLLGRGRSPLFMGERPSASRSCFMHIGEELAVDTRGAPSALVPHVGADGPCSRGGTKGIAFVASRQFPLPVSSVRSVITYENVRNKFVIGLLSGNPRVQAIQIH